MAQRGQEEVERRERVEGRVEARERKEKGRERKSPFFFGFFVASFEFSFFCKRERAPSIEIRDFDIEKNRRRRIAGEKNYKIKRRRRDRGFSLSAAAAPLHSSFSQKTSKTSVQLQETQKPLYHRGRPPSLRRSFLFHPRFLCPPRFPQRRRRKLRLCSFPF